MQLKSAFFIVLVLAFSVVGIHPDRAVCEEESEGSLTLADLPEAVRTTIGEQGKGVEPTEIEREESGGFVFYEAEFKEGETTREIKMDAEGRVVEFEEELPPSSLPSGAVNRIEESYSGYEIEEVELKTVIYYEIEIEVDGKEFALRVLENGSIPESADDEEEGEEDQEDDDEAEEVEEEGDLDWADLPGPVQTAIEGHRPGVKPKGFEKERSRDATFYEAEYPEMDGVKHEIMLDELGNIVEIEDELPVSKLPESVRKQIETTYPNGKIEEVELKQSTFYAVELEKGDNEIEIRIFATGHLLGFGDSD